jgi:8-oxo-dGTP pyrophosphatase MutT (NUDIX family)
MIRKVLIIPYLRYSANRKTRIFIVRHTASQDWTFISGTCETYEPPNACVCRELKEETHGYVRLHKIPKKTRRIRIQIRENTHRIRVDVYFIPLTRNSRIMQQFTDAYYCYKQNIQDKDENCDMDQCSYSQILKQKRFWTFLTDNIIPNKSFQEMIQRLRF